MTPSLLLQLPTKTNESPMLMPTVLYATETQTLIFGLWVPDVVSQPRADVPKEKQLKLESTFQSITVNSLKFCPPFATTPIRNSLQPRTKAKN